MTEADDDRTRLLPVGARRAAKLHASVTPARAVIERLTAALEAKDPVTGRHQRRASRLAVQLAERIDAALAHSAGFRVGCLLHDVGKLGIPQHILVKPDALTEDEWVVVRRHPRVGADIVRALGLPPTVVGLVASHHERWDGTGYPDGLAGVQIPLAARILAVCDALEAMTAHRPYRPALSADEAFARIRAEAGRQFDPGIVAALERAVDAGDIDLDAPDGAVAEERELGLAGTAAW